MNTLKNPKLTVSSLAYYLDDAKKDIETRKTELSNDPGDWELMHIAKLEAFAQALKKEIQSRLADI